MNRDQKAAAIAEITADIEASEAIFAVDYRGISVAQAAELRAKLREADASFRVVKNTLTERAADGAGTEALKPLLKGPTALTFVRGDAALAAKAVADYARTTQLLPFKGGVMGAEVLDAEQIKAISRLPSREVLYGQLVGVVASPLTGLVRTLGALVGGLAVALGQVREKKESGEIPAGEPPAAAAAPAAEAPPAEVAPDSDSAVEVAPESESAAEAEAPAAEEAPAADATPEPEAAAEAEAPAAEETPAAEEAPAAEAEAQAEDTTTTENQTEPGSEPADDDNQAEASADDQSDTAEANKED